MRKKTVDVLLICLAVGGLAYGALTVGRLVTDESNSGFDRSAGLTRTTPRSSTRSSTRDPLRNHRTEIRIGLVAVAGLILLWTLSFTLRFMRIRRRGRRRERSRRI